MTTVLWTYAIYLGVSAAVTVWVGRTLQKHGKVFATTGREKSPDLIDSFSRLLEVGFYLLNFGVINIALRYGGVAHDAESAMEILSMKIGTVLLVLGAVHLLMTLAFNGIRKSRTYDDWHTNTPADGFDAPRETATYSR
ncbi:MAG: hypothetical protein ACE5KM_16385 [Planctomycetaceae bacterium]